LCDVDLAGLGVVRPPSLLAGPFNLADLPLKRELVRQRGRLTNLALQLLELIVVLSEVGLQTGPLVFRPPIELVHLLVEPCPLAGTDVVKQLISPLLCCGLDIVQGKRVASVARTSRDVEQSPHLLCRQLRTVVRYACED